MSDVVKPSKTEKVFPSMCRTCRRSSVVKSICIFEDLKKMAYCHTYIRIKVKTK